MVLITYFPYIYCALQLFLFSIDSTSKCNTTGFRIAVACSASNTVVWRT